MNIIDNIKKINEIKHNIKSLSTFTFNTFNHYPFNEKFQINTINENDVFIEFKEI